MAQLLVVVARLLRLSCAGFKTNLFNVLMKRSVGKLQRGVHPGHHNEVLFAHI